MPPIVREIEQAAIGCWTLIRGNGAGLLRFDLSVDGFWRSFRWAFVLAVLDALDGLSLYSNTQPDENTAPSSSVIWVLTVSAIASLLTFFVFPLIVGLLAKPMGLSKPYPTYIIVRNWLTVFISLPVYVLDGLNALGLMPVDLRELLIFVLIAVSLLAETVITRRVLGTAQSLSFGFALLDFLLTQLIAGLSLQLIT
jgi:hypothetical protein